MKPLFAFIVSAIILAVLAIAYPDALLSPGKLTKGHNDINNNCLVCHTPFRSITSVQCINCHKQSDIGLKTVAGTFLNKSNTKVLFHKSLADNSCVECHTDHKGTVAKEVTKPFRHASLSPQLRKDCIACHKNQKPNDSLHQFAKGNCLECHQITSWKPATFDHKSLTASGEKTCINCHKIKVPNDRLHQSVSSNCAECHLTTRWKPATFDHKKFTALSGKQCISCHKTDRPNDRLHQSFSSNCAECHLTTRWKPATFDHKKFTALSGKQCISCHKADQPADDMHRQSQASCGTCHGTTRWKPATFNHNQYFRLDRDHRASCKTCHTDPGNYKKYTCYNCHEHSQSNIAEEHREEGIYNYQNCMKCHRNGKAEEDDD